MSRLPFFVKPDEQPTRPIPILRVVGFPPDSPEADLLADAFSGSVRQFYTQQARNYALGVAAQSNKAVDRGDHQIRYQASNGTEIVTLKVHPKRARELLSKKPKRFWDWALVDIVVPDARGVVVNAAGYLQGYDATTLKGVGAAGGSILYEGYESFAEATEADTPRVELPAFNIAELQGSADAEVCKGTIKIDLRGARGMPAVVVDLYAEVERFSCPRALLTGWEQAGVGGEETIIVASTEIVYVAATFTADREAFFDGQIAARGQSFTYATWDYDYFPITYGPHGIVTLEERYRPIETFVSDIGDPGPSDGDIFLEEFEVRQRRYVEDPVYECVGPQSYPCEIRALLLQGTPDWSYTYRFEAPTALNVSGFNTGGLDYYQWEVSDEERPSFPLIGEHVIAEAGLWKSEPPELFYGLPYFGRLTIDLVGGGASFAPGPPVVL